MQLFGHTINQGTKLFTSVEVGELSHKGKVNIPLIVLRSNKVGPILWINGAVHGAELNGSVAAYRLAKQLGVNDFAGTIIITPISNALAFQRRDKISDLDYQDMDTAFPGKHDGTFTQRIAYTIYSEIKSVKPDCVINCHTMGPYWEAVRYTVSKIVPGATPEVIERSHNLALAFGVKTNCYLDLQNAAGELPGVTSGALDITCMIDGVPCFMAELGGGGRLQEDNIAGTIEGFYNVMIELGMYEGVPSTASEQIIITKRGFTRCDHGGLIEMAVQPGDTLSEGQVQARIHYFNERVDLCHVKSDTYFIGVRYNPVVNTGDPVSFVGYEWHTSSK
jgi:predicted deacylase